MTEIQEIFYQERPEWCPHPDCRFKRRALNDICVGDLPEPVPHDNDKNTYRLCLNGVLGDGSVFDLQMNNTDLWWFRWLFDALDGKDSAGT